MAINVIDIKYNKAVRNTIHEFICDTDADFTLLPKCDPGSTAVSVATGTIYVVNASGNWVEFGVGETGDEPEGPAASEGLAFTLKDDGTYEVSGIGECTDLDVVIPAEVDGTPVTSIGNGAFYNCTDLTSVIIPTSVTSIDDSAFYGCSSLISAPLPENVISIGNTSFSNCQCLTSVIIPDNIDSISSAAFAGCTGLTTVVIGNNVVNIGQNAFANCYNITNLTLGNSLTYIQARAFATNLKLTALTFNGTVAEWNAKTFNKSLFYNQDGTLYVQCTDGTVALK